MVRLNRKIEYALVALKYMTGKIPGELTTAKEISDTLARNDEKITRLNEIVGDVVNVDLTEVAARLSAAQTQYQASASIFGQLKGMNLLQYLR